MRDWFRACPDAGIGIVTGTISGLVVLDVDVRHGGDVALQQLERDHGRLPRTVECQTGGGGRHLYVAHPAALVRNQVGLAPGIDIRADGGYVVAQPSLHASGLRYVWVDGGTPDDIAVAPLPDWLRRDRIDATGLPDRSLATARFRRCVSGRTQQHARISGRAPTEASP